MDCTGVSRVFYIPLAQAKGGSMLAVGLFLSVELAVGLFLLVELGWARVIPVDKVYPHLTADGVGVDWSSGGPSSLLAGSTGYVRVNRRGVRVSSRPTRVRDLGRLGWAGIPCNASAVAMCQSEMGRIFPLGPLRTPGDRSGMPLAWRNPVCSNTKGRLFTTSPEYDVGSCDVLDEKVDLVLSWGTLFRSVDPMEDWEYWCLVAAAVVLVRGVSRNLRAKLQHGDSPSQDLTLASCALCVIVVARDGGGLYATDHDFSFYAATIAYTLGYLVYHGAMRILEPHPPPVYNMAAGAFQLIASRLYCGAETPYNPVVIFVVITRALGKLQHPTLINTTTSLVDCFYAAMACDAGFTPSPQYLIPLFAGAYVASARVFGAAG